MTVVGFLSVEEMADILIRHFGHESEEAKYFCGLMEKRGYRFYIEYMTYVFDKLYYGYEWYNCDEKHTYYEGRR